MNSEPLPLINAELSQELFERVDDPESDQMQREIWSHLRAELQHDLENTLEKSRTAGLAVLKADLHRIRGYCASCALSRLAGIAGKGGILRDWECHPDPVAASAHYGPIALAIARDSIGEMERIYPHLAG